MGPWGIALCSLAATVGVARWMRHRIFPALLAPLGGRAPGDDDGARQHARGYARRRLLARHVLPNRGLANREPIQNRLAYPRTSVRDQRACAVVTSREQGRSILTSAEVQEPATAARPAVRRGARSPGIPRCVSGHARTGGPPAGTGRLRALGSGLQGGGHRQRGSGRLSGSALRKLREIIRLKVQAGQSGRAIARRCALSPSTASEYLGRIALAGLAWPLLPEFDDDAALERLLSPTSIARCRTGPTGSGSRCGPIGPAVRADGGFGNDRRRRSSER